MGEALSLDSRVARTVLPFLFRPGFVAAEILAGRRARYTSAVRLYLVATFLFFLAVGLAPEGGGAFGLGVDDAAQRAEERTGLEAAARELRGQGVAGTFLADRLDHLRAIPPEELPGRLGAAFVETAPKVLFFLVPVLALLLWLAWRRRYYAEHLLVAVHAQSLAYLALLPGAATGVDALGKAGAAAVPVWMLLAARRVYGEGWARTSAKLALVAVAYLAALGAAMVATALLAFAVL